jgi:hypothetical protein
MLRTFATCSLVGSPWSHMATFALPPMSMWLLALKQRAGRPQDALDIQQLTALKKDRTDEA